LRAADRHKALTMQCFGSKNYHCDHDSYIAVQYMDGHIEHMQGPCTIWYNKWKHASVEVIRHKRYVATEKQCVVVVDRDGKSERRMGPCQVTLDPLSMISCKVEDLCRYVASQSEYLIVQFRDGRKEHMRGPQEIVLCPLQHETISVHEAMRLAANEALVVYRRVEIPDKGSAPELVAKLEIVPTTAESGMSKATTLGAGATRSVPPLLTAEAAGQEGAVHVERRVVHGPAVFMPDANEWVHTFSWHGSLKDGKGSKTGYAGDIKVPHALNFQIIRCMPDQMYLSVRDVRSVDDANLTVHLMLFYELQSIETMLDSTNDMIGDFVNAASADVMTFASRLTYEQFLQETIELSRVDNFPILSARMEQTGVRLLKVVYRGYSAAPALQQMHDEAISRRTKLRLEADAAREEQEKRAMELRCRQERSVQEQDLEAAAARHKLSVASLQKEQDRRLHDEEHAAQLRYMQERASAELASERERHDEQMRRDKEEASLQAQRVALEREGELKKLEALSAMGVDLTAYLCALSTAPPDQHLRIDTGSSASPPALHMELPKVSAANGRGNGRGQ